MKIYFLVFFYLIQTPLLASKLACAFKLGTSVLSSSLDPKYEFSCKEVWGIQILRKPLHSKFLICTEKNTALTFSIATANENENTVVVSGPRKKAVLTISPEFIQALTENQNDFYFHAQTSKSKLFDFFETQILTPLLPDIEMQVRLLLDVNNYNAYQSTQYKGLLNQKNGESADFQIEGGFLPYTENTKAGEIRKSAHNIVQVRFHKGYFDLIHYEYSSRKIARRARFSIFYFLDKDNHLSPNIIFASTLIANADTYNARWTPLSVLPPLNSISILPQYGFKIDEEGNISGREGFLGKLVSYINSTESFEGVVVNQTTRAHEKTPDGQPKFLLDIYVLKDGKPHVLQNVPEDHVKVLYVLNEDERNRYFEKYRELKNELY